MITAGVGAYYYGATARATMLPATGIVSNIAVQNGYDSDTGGSSTSCCPTIQFTTQAGQAVTVDNMSDCSSSQYYHVGDPIEIYYDPANPKNFPIKNSPTTLVVPGVLSFIGGICAYVGAIAPLGSLLTFFSRRY
jgi:hypothetical protein